MFIAFDSLLIEYTHNGLLSDNNKLHKSELNQILKSIDFNQ